MFLNRLCFLFTAAAVSLAVIGGQSLADVVVSEDFFYQQDSVPQDFFTGANKFTFQDYGGGQNGSGTWETRWEGLGSGAIISDDQINEPFVSNPFSATVTGSGASGGGEVSRPYSFNGGAAGISTLYFAADLMATSPGSATAMLGELSIFSQNGDQNVPQVSVGIRNNTFFGAIGAESAEGDGIGVAADFTDDGAYHRIVGKLELNAVANIADYNSDGNVNAADYTVWRDTLGSTTDLRADGDENGTVEAADYEFWRTRFGETSSERLTVFIDPTGTDTSAGSTLTVEAELFTTAFDDGAADPRVFINGGAAGGGRRHFADDVVVGTTYDDVDDVSVPRLTLEVDTSSGDVTLVNNTSQSFDLTYYEIESESDSLDPTGMGLGDQGVTGWVENLSGTSTIAETNLFDSSTIASGGGTLSLGSVFDTAGSQDLLARWGTLDGGEGFLNLADVVYVVPAGNAIPEPGTLVLLSMLALAVVQRPRR